MPIRLAEQARSLGFRVAFVPASKGVQPLLVRGKLLTVQRGTHGEGALRQFLCGSPMPFRDADGFEFYISTA